MKIGSTSIPRGLLALTSSLLSLVACPQKDDDAPADEAAADSSEGGLDENTSATDEVGTNTESQSDDDSDSESEGGTFVPDEDTDPTMQCEPYIQDCPEGEKCVWAVPENGSQRRDGAVCIPVTGDRQPFSTCSLPTGIGQEISDDCGAESFCLEVYGTADHGFCVPFAKDTADFTPCDDYPGTEYATENGSSFPDACLFYDCSPLLAESCPDEMRCVFYPASLYVTNICLNVPAEYELPVGAPCDFGGCGEGKLCAPQEWLPACAGERCCTQWCDLDSPSCATEGTQCEFFPIPSEYDNPDYTNLGACLVPEPFE
ncbi:hypothetical protein G6O69_13355 [Pseudenhygromyxa sp. WMMC2535]|uniref:hypothetical protein n=1 Tax=Pseudenhygromyxa sp. WMMC2535 TaxID=2712867 RepID=UPI0015526F63|nr:hypothetical protein [Pseudenhygromyxa sp. WMMC2535]NVB38822.1 hypothetical protein [Pseudenhygromyxa sp. WMMC2535]